MMYPRFYLKLLPRAKAWRHGAYYATRPSMGCFARTSLLLVLFALAAVKLFGQVDAVLQLRGTDAEMRVANPTPNPLRVSIALYRNAPTGHPPLGDTVDARISPKQFTLHPGQMQMVRLRIQAVLHPGEVLRLATTFTPVEQPDASPGLHLVLATRLITRVQAAP